MLIAFALGFALASPAAAEVFLSKQEALELAFPDADRVERKTLVLTSAQAEAVEARARAKLDSKLATVYTGVRGGETLGHAFIDVHTVRTLPEAFLVVLSPEGEVRTLRLLAFYEPPEYAPSDAWLAQFDRRRLDDELALRRGIHGIAGATLSSRAVTGAVRRALALQAVLLREDAAVPVAREPAAEPGVIAGGR